MQTVWGRAAQARTSCRCPHCSFQHRSVPRRRNLASVAQNLCSSTTGFAISFSSAVAGASYIDIKSKQKRRVALEKSIAEAQAEVSAIRANQEARLRELGIDLAAGLDGLGEQLANLRHGKILEKDGSFGILARDRTAPILQDVASQKLLAKEIRERPHLLSYTRDEPAKEFLAYCDGLLEENMELLRSASAVSEQSQQATEDYYQEMWTSAPTMAAGTRDNLLWMILVSRLIHQFQLLRIHMRRPKGPIHLAAASADCMRKSEDQQAGVAQELRESLRKLEVVFKKARESLWHVHTAPEEMDRRMQEVINELPDLGDTFLPGYAWTSSESEYSHAMARQEDELLALFAAKHPHDILLGRLCDTLGRQEFAPSIHMMNIMIIRLCDHGLPCAAKLVLECLRRSPTGGNAITHEAALRCALLDRDEKFFVAYYENVQGQNTLGWHVGHPDPSSKPIYRHALRLSKNFAPQTCAISSASLTPRTDEVIIRSFLRSRCITQALEHYRQLLERQQIPTPHLLEAFLRYCFANLDIPLSFVIWRHFKTICETPPSSAYYWMLGLLATPNLYDHQRGLTKNQTSELFAELAAEVTQEYQLPEEPQMESFQSSLSRKDLFRQAAIVEDLSSPQLTPGQDSSLEGFDLLRGHARHWVEEQPNRPKVGNLQKYISLQHKYIARHSLLQGRVRTTYMEEQFFTDLATATMATDMNFRSVPRQTAEAVDEISDERYEALEAETDAGPQWIDVDENPDSYMDEVAPPAAILPLLRPASPAMPAPGNIYDHVGVPQDSKSEEVALA